MADEPIRIESDRLRIDLTMNMVSEGPDGTLIVEMVPDPRRYEWRDDEEGRALYDRKTGLTYPEKVALDALKQMEGAPIYAPPQDIPEPTVLFRARRRVIEAGLRGTDQDQTLADPAGEAFAARLGEDLGFAVVCVDLVGSTRLQAESPDVYNVLVPILQREVADVAAVFGGLVIKFTGDGAIVGFPEPGFNVQADMAFDAATAIVADVYAVLVPLARKAGFPAIDIRVGADANEATIKAVGSSATRRAPDVLGIAVSMSAKVEGQGEPGEVWVGQTLYENLHVTRQEYLRPAPPREGWNFVDRDHEPYRLYRLRLAPPSV